jgi:hypothetical protein
MWRRVGLVKPDVSEKGIASIIRVARIGELGTLAVNYQPKNAALPDSLTSYIDLISSSGEER